MAIILVADEVCVTKKFHIDELDANSQKNGQVIHKIFFIKTQRQVKVQLRASIKKNLSSLTRSTLLIGNFKKHSTKAVLQLRRNILYVLTGFLTEHDHVGKDIARLVSKQNNDCMFCRLFTTITKIRSNHLSAKAVSIEEERIWSWG